jgi:hypothetical protein
MSAIPARLDRFGTLYSNTPTIGVGGAVNDALVRLCDLAVAYETPTSRTILAGARDAEQTETVFVCRWFEGLRVGMVFTTEGQSYRITRRDQLGRREAWRFYGREIA